MPRYFLAKISSDVYFKYALDNKLWLLQQQYSKQNKSAVTVIWSTLGEIKDGDYLLLGYENRIHAIGKVCIPRKLNNSVQIASIKESISNKKNEFHQGFVRYSDSEVFYEDFSQFDGEWGQRIDVASWDYYSENGISIYGAKKGSVSGNTYYTIYEINESYFNQKKEELMKETKITKKKPTYEKNVISTNKNTIIFGPPGTGKTYATIAKAIKIADPDYVFPLDSSSEQSRKVVKAKYKELVDLGQIVFTTFHQSMSYEDFVEGLKPSTSNGEITYDVKPGIFKSICSKAIAVKSSNFSEAYNALIKKMSSLDDPHYRILTKTKTPFYVSVNQNGNLNLFTTENKNKQGAITKENLELFSLGENPFIGWEGYVFGIINHLKEKYGLEVVSESKKKNHVLIIDEINRGNVSQIFGELITLIEDDKRLGREEALEVMLPYSKKKFGVPTNLYIIGTMNTADRSVEALDTALRRRFSFEFVGPNSSLVPETVGEIKLRELFETINARISYLLDEDHQIGHSYFMEVKSIGDLKLVFENKLIPLLKEYFYNDYGKIRLVLGDGFVTKTESNKSAVSFAVKDEDFVFDKATFSINSISTEEDFRNAIEPTLINA